MIRRLHNNLISEEDLRAILRQRLLLASRSPLPSASNESCTAANHLYAAWSDSSTAYVSYAHLHRRVQIAAAVRIVNKQRETAEAHAAKVVPFEKPFPKDESPYKPETPTVPRLVKLRK